MAARHTILITASELADELKGEAPPVLLDCRFNLLDPEEGRAQYREGHIPSALYLHLNDDLSAPVEPGQTGRHPLPDLSALGQLLARLGINRDTPVVIYDQHQAGFRWALLVATAPFRRPSLSPPRWWVCSMASRRWTDRADRACSNPHRLGAWGSSYTHRRR